MEAGCRQRMPSCFRFRVLDSQARLAGGAVQTNILVFGLAPGAPDAPTLVANARERGVLLNALGPRTVRAVTHLDVSPDQCRHAADVLVELAGQ